MLLIHICSSKSKDTIHSWHQRSGIKSENYVFLLHVYPRKETLWYLKKIFENRLEKPLKLNLSYLIGLKEQLQGYVMIIGFKFYWKCFLLLLSFYLFFSSHYLKKYEILCCFVNFLLFLKIVSLTLFLYKNLYTIVIQLEFHFT